MNDLITVFGSKSASFAILVEKLIVGAFTISGESSFCGFIYTRANEGFTNWHRPVCSKLHHWRRYIASLWEPAAGARERQPALLRVVDGGARGSFGM